MSELKILEWNIHGAASMGWNNTYEIKKFVVDSVMSIKADIVIITEFIVARGWDYFQTKLEDNNYIWFMSYTTSRNGILIAVNGEIDGLNIDDISMYNPNMITIDLKSKTTEKPNFLQVKILVNGKPLSIIGVRIRDDCFKNKCKQFKALLEHNESIEKDGAIIVAGDFNHGAIKNEKDVNFDYKGNDREDYNYQMIRKMFKVNNYETYTPDYGTYGRKFSWIMKNPMIKIKEDHIITKNVSVTNQDYLWDFMSPINGYGNLELEDYKSDLMGLPDHAILTANIDLND